MVEILIVIGAAIIIGNTIAEKFKLIAPLVLIAVGALVSFTPHLPPITVDPHLVLSVFLPLLLYWEALNISLRGIKRTFRGIMLNGTLMVIFVAVSVGLVGHLVGLTLGAALLIGAAVGPTDATAVAALGKGISPRQMIVLRAESLINDGTALVVFALALEYATDEVKITATHAIGSFLLSFVGGAVVGLAVGWVIARIGRFVESHMIASAFRMVTPFIAFFLAEEIEASGVLAVVVTGLYMAQVGPKFVSMQSRVLARQVWGVASYILNSLLFLLVGLYLPATVRGLNSDSLTHALLATVAIYCAMMLARWIFGETIIRLIRMLDRRPSQKLRRTTVFERLVSTVAGFRGAISLAVAFSIPETLANGEPFPYRDQIIFVTSGVVILSLLVQGLLLPKVVELTQKNPNPLEAQRSQADAEEFKEAVRTTAERVLEDLPQLVEELDVPQGPADRVRGEWERKLTIATSWQAGNEENERAAEVSAENALRLRVIQSARQHIIDLRDAGRIDDEVLIAMMDRYDIEEMRLVGPIEME